jgi:putative redox protein
VVTINSPAHLGQITTHFEEKLAEIRREGVANVDIVGRPYPISRKFLEDLETQNTTHGGAISQLGKALLVCQSPNDDVVPLQEALDMFEGAEHPKSFVSLDNADHYLFKREDSEYVAGVISAWVERYL